MSWPITVLLIVAALLLWNALDHMGVFSYFERRINPAPVAPAPARNEIDPAALSALKSDIDKLKLTLNFKEFKK